MDSFVPLLRRKSSNQSGINMVDLMMWLVIAALLLAAAIQGIGYYQRAAFVSQAKSDLSAAHTWVMARTAITSTVPTADDMQVALANGELKLTKNGLIANSGVIASKPSGEFCIGVKAASLNGDNLFYSSSKNPNDVKVEASLPSDCGFATETVPVRTPAEIQTNFATLTWSEKTTATNGNGYWMGIDGSADLQRLYASKNHEYVYTSTDGGNSWTAHPELGAGVWWGFGASTDGKNVIASNSMIDDDTDPAKLHNGYIMLSKDYGATWTKAPLPDAEWTRVTSSSDGSRLAVSAHQDGGFIYTSVDGGATWTQRIAAGQGGWQSLAASADGRKLFAGSQNGLAYISTDGGATWAVQTALGSGDWHDADISADGKYIISGDATRFLYTTNDGGLTWNTASPGSIGWRAVAISDDGNVMVAGQRNGNIWTSIDAGKTWIKRPDSTVGTWYAVATTPDGSKILTMKYGGNAFVGTYSK